MSEIGSCFTWRETARKTAAGVVPAASRANGVRRVLATRSTTFAVSTLHSSNRDHPLPPPPTTYRPTDLPRYTTGTRHDTSDTRHIFPLDYDIEVALAAESMSALHQSCANIGIITMPAAATSAQFYPTIARTQTQQRSHSQLSNATRALLSTQKSSRRMGRKARARTMKQRARVLVLRYQQETRALLHCLPVRTHHQTRTSHITPQHRFQN